MTWTSDSTRAVGRTEPVEHEFSRRGRDIIVEHSIHVAIARHRSVGGLRRALSFAKLRSDKNQAKRPGSSFRADSLQRLCRLFGGPARVMFAGSTETRQELRRLCPLSADRTQEGDKQTGLGWTW